jgi:hypothetical protein
VPLVHVLDHRDLELDQAETGKPPLLAPPASYPVGVGDRRGVSGSGPQLFYGSPPQTWRPSGIPD